jgi:DNA end-binding protein Ku
MESSGLVALGKFVMRGKQHLGCLRIRQSVLVLEKMYFADEVRPIPDLAVKDVRVDKAQLEMASELITRFTGSFDIEKYRDDYRQAVLGLIRAKWKGKDVRPDVPERAEPPRSDGCSSREHRGQKNVRQPAKASIKRALEKIDTKTVASSGPLTPGHMPRRTDDQVEGVALLARGAVTIALNPRLRLATAINRA